MEMKMKITFSVKKKEKWNGIERNGTEQNGIEWNGNLRARK